MLESLGVSHLADRRPESLSQGEAQRVAVARALIHRPALVIADEPTSALDDANCAAVLKLMFDMASAHGATLLIATHDARIKAHFGQCIELGNAA
jgi:putative ABC transport system ATP-binding protein